MSEEEKLVLAHEAVEAALVRYRQTHMLRWIHESQTIAAVDLARAYAHLRRLQDKPKRRAVP